MRVIDIQTFTEIGYNDVVKDYNGHKWFYGGVAGKKVLVQRNNTNTVVELEPSIFDLMIIE